MSAIIEGGGGGTVREFPQKLMFITSYPNTSPKAVFTYRMESMETHLSLWSCKKLSVLLYFVLATSSDADVKPFLQRRMADI